MRKSAAARSIQQPSALAAVVVTALLTFSWLNPYSQGPSTAASTWLAASVSLTAAVLLSIARHISLPSPANERHAISFRWLALSLVVVTVAAWHSNSVTDVAALLGSLALMAVAMQLGRACGVIREAHVVMIRPWLVAGIVSALVGLIQYGGYSSDWQPFVSWSPAGEAYGNLRQRNQFASLANIALVAVVAWIATTPRTRHARIKVYAIATLGAMLLSLANAASASRTGLVQLAVITLLVALWRRDTRTTALMTCVWASYLAASFWLPWIAGLDPTTHGVFARLDKGDPVCSSRLTLWSNVVHLISVRPWMGWGWGELDYAHFMAIYEGPKFCDILDNAHNLPLHLAVELGIPLAAVICGAAVCWVICRRPWRETEPVRQLAWLVLIIIGIHSLLEYPLWYAPFQIAIGICVGLLRQSRSGDGGPKRFVMWRPVILPAVLLASTAYAAWDYWRISQIYLPLELRSPQFRQETLRKLQGSWLFANQVRFAELTTTPLTRENAAQERETALILLHFSPERRVVEKLVKANRLLNRDTEATLFELRLQDASSDKN